VQRPASPRTKLVCTIGPASASRLDELIAAGMSVARVNLAHGAWSDVETMVRDIRAAAEAAGRDVAILADLAGPKLRLGALAAGAVTLEAGRDFRIGPGEAGDANGAAANHSLAADLQPGDRVLLADGAAELRVTGSRDGSLETVVERAGTIRSRAGIAVPSQRLSLPALTSADKAALPGLVALGIDFVGLSFVRQGSDVSRLREALDALPGSRKPAIVAKIETIPAVENAEAIIRAADAVMVARGDLGVELPFEQVPLLQKQLVRTARALERPVIIATQMLESMTAAPRPTRAEASDVANAVFEGVDAVMLSAETAIGSFPVEAAQAAVRILAAADAFPKVAEAGARSGLGTAGTASSAEIERAATDDPRAVTLAAIELARLNHDVRAIACFTRTGTTAALLAAGRPRVPIVAFSPDPTVRRRLALNHGVLRRPIEVAPGPELRSSLARAAMEAVEMAPGEALVLVATTAGGADGPNVVELVRAGS
jgi:pyruvate kinase